MWGGLGSRKVKGDLIQGVQLHCMSGVLNNLLKDETLDKAVHLLQKTRSLSQPMQIIMHGLKQLQKAS